MNTGPVLGAPTVPPHAAVEATEPPAAPTPAAATPATLPPPSPSVSAELLALVSTLVWVAFITATSEQPALGWFRNRDGATGSRYLALVADLSNAIGGIGHAAAWALTGPTSNVDAACVRFVLSLETAHVLQEGELHETGAVVWQGRPYRIEAQEGASGMDGCPVQIAKAVPW